MRENHLRYSRTSAGFSIVELMISVLIGAFVLNGIVEVYGGSKQTYRAVEELSRLQENARYSMQIITRTARNAGYNGCSTRQGPLTNTLNNPNSVEFDFATGANGFEANSSAPGSTVTISSEYPAASGSWSGGTVPSAVSALAVAGSDILVLRGPVGDNVPVAKNNNGSQLFTAIATTNRGTCPDANPSLSGFCDGDIVMVTDCTKSRVFQVTGLAQTSSNPCSTTEPCLNLQHASSGTPGNAITSWGGSSAPDGERFGPDSDIVRIQTSMFFVGVGADGSPSLYQRLDSAAPVELIPGVENMQVLYGEDSSGDGVANQYRTADTVVDEQAIVSLRISLLLRTTNEISPDTNTLTHLLSGATAAAATTVDPFNDRRGRYVFNATIKLRNRGA
jgi:type IV pilus assembly protein PilW